MPKVQFSVSRGAKIQVFLGLFIGEDKSHFYWRKAAKLCQNSAKKTVQEGEEKGRRKEERKQEIILALCLGSCSVFGSKFKGSVHSFFSYFPALFGCLLRCEIKRRNPEKFGFKGGRV